MKSIEKLAEISIELKTEVVRTRRIITMVNIVNIFTIIVLIIMMVKS